MTNFVIMRMSEISESAMFLTVGERASYFICKFVEFRTF